MLKIAICDDEVLTRETILQYLAMIAEGYEERFEIVQFESGDALCALIPQLDFDLIFIDYMMEGTNGLNTAKAISESGNETSKIIFISSFDDYAKFLPRLGVIDFIDKPVDYEALREAFAIYYNKIYKRETPTFSFKYKREKVVACIDDIECFETGKQHAVVIHLHNGFSAEFRSTIHNVWEEVKEYECFVQPTQSIIVNLNYASEVNNKSLKIKGIEVLITRLYKQETNERYMDFLKKKAREDFYLKG